MNTLLILGTRTDPHVERVALELERRQEIAVVVLDYLDATTFSLHVDKHGHKRLTINNKQLPEKYLVWDCAKLMPGTSFYLANDDENSGYAAEEWRALHKLLCGMAGDEGVNSLSSRVCMIKPYQQIIAASVGFNVPPTLVTNDKNAALQCVDSSKDGAIMKSLSSCKVRPPSEGEPIYYNVMTMRVTHGDIDEAKQEDIAYCPHFFQHEVIKSHELRVVYVDGKMFGFKINSQEYKTSEVDWRHGYSFLKFTNTHLDDSIQVAICRFMERMGLFSGSLDFIVDRDDKYWFLECNQQGAWGWLENPPDMCITQAFADALTQRVLEVGKTSLSPPISSEISIA